MQVTRRLVLATPLLLLACGRDDPPQSYEPIRYGYLTPLRLNVASIELAPLPPPGRLDAASPVAAATALRQLAEDRLYAGGSSGRALVTVEEASIVGEAGNLDGRMALRIDILSQDGAKLAYTEARVARRRRDDERSLAKSLYDITKQLTDDVNVELEYRIRLSLKDYIQDTSVEPAPGPVQKEDLQAPKPNAGK